MSITWKVLLATMAALLVTFVSGGTFFYLTERAESVERATVTVNGDLDEVVRDVEVFIQKAKDDLVMAANNPVFDEYFSLEDTVEGNVYDEDEVLQFSDDQREIKNEMEEWIGFFQSRFNVDEMCLIDTEGQEHVRLTFGDPVDDDELSPHEAESPFFDPGFAVAANDVSVVGPYLSPDTNRWVISFTTPVEVDGDKVAILHFEVSLDELQKFVVEVDESSHKELGSGFDGDSHEGHEFWLINDDGYVLGTSGEVVDYEYEGEIRDERDIEKVKLVDEFGSVSEFEGLGSQVWERIRGRDDDSGYINSGEGKKMYYSVVPLGLFDWKVMTTISYNEVAGIVLKRLLVNLVSILVLTLVLVSVVVGLVVKGILKPVVQLTQVADDISKGKLDTHIEGLERKDEIGKLTRAFERTVVSLKLAMRNNMKNKEGEGGLGGAVDTMKADGGESGVASKDKME